MLISLTVGKVDAGVAVLLTEDKRLIEFPSILLPPSISSGSIVDITVSRNLASESTVQKSFLALQSSIHSTYGIRSPSPPVLRCRNATQTSVVLEWDPIQLATAKIRSLSLFRNGSKAGAIPRPLEITSTKISGLAIDTNYTFHLVLKTSAGQYSSEKLTIKTHKMTDLSGITVTPGVLPAPLRYSLAGAVERIGGKIVETVRIDTTHFVCTEGRGAQWERAVEMNIPVVRPEWVEGCEREGRIVGVRGYYLNADPRLRQVGQGVNVQQQSRRTDSTSSISRPGPAGHEERSQQATPQTGSTTMQMSDSPLASHPPNGMATRDTHESRTYSDAPPPKPPAKDLPHRGPPPESSEATSDDDEEEEEHDDEKNGALSGGPGGSQGQGRALVQSPFESGSGGTSTEMAGRDLGREAPKGLGVTGRKGSDGGSFSEVQL